jgi:putative flavoprotein involved in K+ transport
MPVRPIDVVIVGAGQAGLAVAHFLQRARCRFVVFERGRVGESWRSQRWDSLVINTPNWMNRLPQAYYDGPNPHGFAPGGHMVGKLEQYAASLQADVRTGVTVRSVEPVTRGFVVRTEADGEKARSLTASNVVIASGFFRVAKVPAVSRKIPDWILQIHSSRYRNAARLPAGAVVLVGSGQSGCQIADDLLGEGREVYLSTSKVARIPRRYRGRDIFEWWSKMGVLDETVEDLEDPNLRYAAQFLISGDANRGRTLSLQELARRGARLLGSLADFQDDRLFFRDNVLENIRYGDRTSDKVKLAVDRYIARAVDPPPPAERDPADEPDPVLEAKTFPLHLNLEEAGVRTIIWCTGYGPDFSWIHAPTFGERGELMHERGQSVVPGLYFAGFPWLHRRKSGLIYGVEEDARYVAQSIVARLFPARRPPEWVEPGRPAGSRPSAERTVGLEVYSRDAAERPAPSPI